MDSSIRLVVDGVKGAWSSVEAPIRIGRSPENDLRLDHPRISRRHIEIRSDGSGGAELVDLGSSNGTTLNGRRVEGTARLRHGDRIELGESCIRVECRGASRRMSIPRAWLWMGGLIMLTLVGAARVVAGTSAEAAPAGESRSEKRFDLRDIEREWVFGSGPEVDEGTPGGAAFRFSFVEAEPGASRISLRYSAAHVGEGSVEVHLNGEAVGFVPAADPRWSEGLELVRPTEKLRPSGSNVVSFVPSYGHADARWEIRAPEIVVEPVPSCPPAECIEQAERYLALGARHFEAKALSPRNLFDAWIAFRKATLFLVPMGGGGELGERASEWVGLARRALDERCSRLRFTVVRSVALGDEAVARSAVEQIFLGFPSGEHACHETANWLRELLDD